MSNIIELKNLNKVYDKNVVIKDLSLQFKKGSFNWIVGHSGSGKTTLLNIMSGLDKATKGQVIIDNTNINRLSTNKLAEFRSKELGFVFQFHYLIPELNALNNVLLPLRIQRIRINKKIKEEAILLMNKVGLGSVYKQMPKTLSGGEAQRTAIARAVIHKPLLVIADEPTGNLDSISAKAVYEVLRNLHKDLQTTFIVVTHDKSHLEKGDRVIELKDGNVIKDFYYDES